MALETATTIDQLVPTNPAHTDGLSQADSHLRLLKSTIQNTLPAFVGALASSNTQLDAAVSTDENGTTKLADAGAFFKTDTDTGVANPAADQLDLVVGGSVGVNVTKSGSDIAATVKGDLTVEDDTTLEGDLVIQGKATGPGTVPIGGTVIWWSDSLPADGNWAWCNGGTYLRSLPVFSIIGTTYGNGNGTTTAALPDLRDCVPVGRGAMGGASAAGRITSAVTGYVSSTLGKIFGAALHTLVTAEMPAHSHVLTDPGHTHDPLCSSALAGAGLSSNPVNRWMAHNNSIANYDSDHDGNMGATSSETTGITMANTGSGTAHSNVQPSAVCNFIIRVS